MVQAIIVQVPFGPPFLAVPELAFGRSTFSKSFSQLEDVELALFSLAE